MSNNVFVNGGMGFIGHHICIELKKNGYFPIAIDHMNQFEFRSDKELYQSFINERYELLKSHSIKVVILDTGDQDHYIKLLKEYQPVIIYHMSAIASAKICQTNPHLAITENLMKVEQVLNYILQSKIKTKFVFASSSVAYGDFETDSVNEETMLNPRTVYGFTKKTAEELIRMYKALYGLTYTILRPSALYGPRCINLRVSQIIIERAIRGETIIINGDGMERLDFSFVDDTVQGFIKAGIKPEGNNQVFNITYGESRPVNLLIDIVREYFPDLKIEYRERDKIMPKRGTLDISKARKILGYLPEYPVERGYPLYIEWYLKREKNKRG
ncbi:MAG: NAD-dependent epimerase/dehydratase family protein [Candidatus Hydrogenedentota bacterium]